MLEGLDERQREAVLAPESRLIVAAGPGTGKTRVLAARIAHLVVSRGVPCRNILALTFTRSAAGEMRERLKAGLSGAPGADRLGELWVETFHAAALRILREQRHPFGPDRILAVASEDDKARALEELVPRRERRAFLEALRLKKELDHEPLNEVERRYQSRLADNGQADYEDVLGLLARLFKSRPEVRDHYGALFQHVLVDEFQDTGPAQYRLLRLLDPDHLCVVGDPDQSIYGFAGCAFKPFERLRDDHPGCRTVALSNNYRSQAAIVAAAGQVISRNPAGPDPRSGAPRARLVALFDQGLPVEIARFQTDRQEAEMVVRKVESLLGGSSHFAIDSLWAGPDGETGRYGFQDIAVLYRTHAQGRRLEEAFSSAGLPVRVFGPKTAEEVAKSEEREDFVTDAEAAPPSFEPRGEWISLMTMHRAKGLEFPVVFATGCEDGVLPYRRELWLGGPAAAGQGRPGKAPSGPDDGLEEERRLFFVAMTRAKSRLFLSHAGSRSLFGRTLQNPPSPFLADILEALLVSEQGRARRKPRAVQPDLFS